MRNVEGSLNLARTIQLLVLLSCDLLCEWKFRTLAEKVLGNPELATDPKFSTNDARVQNRTELVQIITGVLMQQDRDHWLERFRGLG
jgi:crotonobetainyl-CoA:carnitine CoA-transferase CaiB-like acyl-CoA transferase